MVRAGLGSEHSDTQRRTQELNARPGRARVGGLARSCWMAGNKADSTEEPSEQVRGN